MPSEILQRIWHSVRQERGREVLEKSVVETCCRIMMQGSVGEEARTEVLGKSVDEKCCSEMLAESIV